jgi:DNA-binding PadR family transcriptional regulator
MSWSSSYPLEQALLGFLMQEPAHGYALHRRAEEELGRIWYMGMSNVYGTLKELEETGQVESSHEEGSYPPRTVYRITAEGRESFMAWVGEPVAAVRDMRVELLAKLYFFHTLGLQGREALLDAQEAWCRERLGQLEQRTAQDRQDEFEHIVSGFRRHRIAATLDWLQTLRGEQA